MRKYVPFLLVLLLTACARHGLEGYWRTDGAVSGKTPQIEMRFVGERFDIETVYANGTPGEKIAGTWRLVKAEEAELVEFRAEAKAPKLFAGAQTVACRLQWKDDKMLLTNGFVGTHGMVFANAAPDGK